MPEKDYVQHYRERTRRSRELFERARRVMPGGVSHRYRHIPPYPFFMQEAQGARIRDVDGNEYIDLWMGHFALILGHRHPVVNEALQEVAEAGLHWGVVHEYQVRFAELIQETVPCAEKVVLGVSGTEATMYAVRLARAYTGRRTVLKAAGGWHGANSELAWYIRRPFEVPESAGLIQEMGRYVRPISFNDLDQTIGRMEEVGEELAAVIVEPVMGAGGMIPARQDYLEMLRHETRRRGALLIFDEIITGYRLTLGGAQEAYKVVPDMATLGKVVGGGANLGVIAGKAEIFDLCDPTIPRQKGEGVMLGGGTFSSSPLSTIVGYRVVDYLRRHAGKLYPRIDAMGERLRRGMEEAFQRHGLVGRTTGRGSLCGAYFPYDPETVVRNPEEMQELTDMEKVDSEFRIRMLNHGVFVMHGGGAVSAAHSEEDIDRILEAVDAAAAEMAEGS